MTSSQLDLLKVTQVPDVQLEKGPSTQTGTLHLTVYNLIFSGNDGELWISYPIIHTVERLPPSLQSGRHPILIKCRDFLSITLAMLKDGEAQDVFESIQKLTCINAVDQLYAYSYQPPTPLSATDGWTIYNPVKEYERMGVGVRSDKWRFTRINERYEYCSTYPSTLVVPSKISDNVLNYAAKYRSRARVPVLSYLHWQNMATITRSSQPMVGFKQARSIQDEKLIEAIFASNVQSPTNGRTIYGSTAVNMIIDARPMVNAMGNVTRGAGTENMDNYRNCKKEYVAIDNIHVMRDSLARLFEGMLGTDNDGQVNRSSLQRSNWLKHISTLLRGTLEIVKHVHVYNSHVLVHCSDGWDRTAQLVSISELCLDPYYRTLRGFQILIEKEWVSFGHKFADRCGHLSNERSFLDCSRPAGNAATNTIKDMQIKFYKSNYYIQRERESSPVFHQFLDCVFQLLQQFPTRFEFNEHLLTELHYHVYTCQYGTFLFNSEKDRVENGAATKTISVWDYINSNDSSFLNSQYDSKKDLDIVDGGGVLFPDPNLVRYWAALFNRQESDLVEPVIYGTPTTSTSLSDQDAAATLSTT